MQDKDIETYLADLGQELQYMGVPQPVRILLVGGAFMLTQLHNRLATGDVDVLLKDIDSLSPLYQTFKNAVRAVAGRNQLSLAWINDVIGDFIRDISIVPQGTLWRTYAALEVYIPPSDYILALKLLAGRQRDKDDIQALCQQLKIQTRAQAQALVDHYVPDKGTQQINDLDDTLKDLFPIP